MKISPWAAIALNILYGILTGLTLPVVDQLGFTGHDTQILAWAGLLAIPLNGIMHAIASSSPGPLAPADPPSVVAAQKVADLTADDSPGKVLAVKAEAKAAIDSRNPKLGPA